LSRNSARSRALVRRRGTVTDRLRKGNGSQRKRGGPDDLKILKKKRAEWFGLVSFKKKGSSLSREKGRGGGGGGGG